MDYIFVMFIKHLFYLDILEYMLYSFSLRDRSFIRWVAPPNTCEHELRSKTSFVNYKFGLTTPMAWKKVKV